MSASGYYAWKGRCQSAHQQRDEELATQIQSIFEASRGRYGSPRIHQELRAQGVKCSEKRVARLMQERGLAASKRRRFVSTTNSRHTQPVAPNLLARQFQVEAVKNVNCVWAGDITYIPTAKGWLYLAVVLDLKSRKVIGWSMANTLDVNLVAQAMLMAVGQRLAKPGEVSVLFHSDRGSQYAARCYQQQLAAWGITASMSGKGNCWDNAPIESFFATLKKELVYREKYQSHEQAKASLFYYIEVFYNRQRRHSALGYKSPHDYEQFLLFNCPP